MLGIWATMILIDQLVELLADTKIDNKATELVDEWFTKQDTLIVEEN